jgi:hypothetical protein
MKNLTFTFIAVIYFLLPASGISQDTEPFQSEKLTKLWSTPDILTTSESVCYDKEKKLFYVSCINGNPTEKDQNGFIALVSLSGDVIMLNWVEGLNAPKGMGIFEGKLYVTDIDQIVEIDIEKASVLKKYPVDRAEFLNDITIDPDGNVYVSDMSTNKIHRLHKGVVETWIDDEQLKSTNGLFYEDKEILAGTKSGIYSIRIEDKRIWHLVKDTGGIDGLESDGTGNYIISDWMGKVQRVGPDMDPEILLNTSNKGINAADIEYIIDRNMLLVPTFSDNRVTAYELIEK